MSTITTEFNVMSENEFINLLISATRKGNITLLENSLTSRKNSIQYLNQVFDQPYLQKCTLLTIACLNGHTGIIRMLLSHYKIDLEVLNNVMFGDINPNQQIFYNVSVLWIATSTNNFNIVKLLVEHGANVNHRTKTNSTPIRGACYNGNIDMARYLISHGADIHISKEHNDTNLMVSVCHKHMNIVNYLINELNCDVNECDDNGRSSLYDAVNCGSIELVEYLLKHGARNFRAISDQMSPVMWAAEKRRLDLVEIFYSYCSILERIEAEELLASAFICGPHRDRVLDQALEYFSRAFKLRLIHNLPKSRRLSTNELFGNQQECQTIDELKQIHLNYNQMYIEALLVRERILGLTSCEYRYSLCYRGAILADNEQHHQALDYWLYEFRLCQQYSITIDGKHLRRFASLFSGMVVKDKSIPMDALITILSATVEQLENSQENFNYNLYTLLYLITITSQIMAKNVLSMTDCKLFYRHLYSINQRHYKTLSSGMSLLHLSLDNQTLVDDYHIRRICKYPCLQTIRMLLLCAADVNEFDTKRNTPLHIIATNKSACNEAIVDLLCNAGAHLDYVNSSRQTPIDLATVPETIQLLKSRMNFSLKCLAARMIRKRNIQFHEKIGISLVSFVEKH